MNLIDKSIKPTLDEEFVDFDGSSGKMKIQIKKKDDYEITLEFRNEKGQQVKKVMKAKVEVTEKVDEVTEIEES